MSDMAVSIGDKIRFAPHAFLTASGAEQKLYGAAAYRQTGEVCLIHEAHGWFRAKYTIQGKAHYECFRFDDEGEKWQRTR